VLLCLFLCTLTFAAPKPPNWKPAKRTFTINPSHDGLRVQAVYKNQTYEDKFTLNVHLDNGAKNLADFHLQYGTNNNGNRTNLDIHFMFNSILEFESDPTNQMYQGNQTSVVQTWPDKGDKSKWGEWTDGSGIVDGVQTYKYTISRGIFTFGVQMASEDVVVHDLPINPNHVKIDVDIHSFPYSKKNTRVALDTTLRSKTTSKISGSKALVDHKLIFDNDPDEPSGSFSWNAEAQYEAINGDVKDIQMGGWTPETQKGNNYEIYYTFLTPGDDMQPAILIWDPTLGLDYDDESSGLCVGDICGGGAYGIIAGAAVFGVLVISGIALFIVKRNKRIGYESVN